MHFNKEELEKAIKILKAIEAIDDRPLYNKVMQRIERRRKTRRLFNFIKASAAILLLAILSGSIFHLMNTPKEPEIIPAIAETETQIQLDKETPSLIMGNGKVITLDTSYEGVLREDSMLTISNKAGKLAYAAKEEDKDVPVEMHTLYVPRGKQYSMIFEDGTQVLLNSDTRLTFPSTFEKHERSVYIEGEAYFLVATHPEKPFVVKTFHQQVTVLGTEFNIYAYKSERYTHTTLAKGQVLLNDTKYMNEVTLLPGQQYCADMKKDEYKVQNVDLNIVLAWVKGQINMDKMTLEDVIDSLSKLYDVEFVFMDEHTKNIVFRGSVTHSGDINTVLENISLASQVRFVRNNHIIEIHSL